MGFQTLALSLTSQVASGWPTSFPLSQGSRQYSRPGPSLGLGKYCHQCDPKHLTQSRDSQTTEFSLLLHVYDFVHDVNRTEPTNLQMAHNDCIRSP